MAERRSPSSIALADETRTIDLARRLAPAIADGAVIHLRGELGVGKTTFARALLQALGARERIKSPTYSLLEHYRVGDHDAFHLDLYRIAAPGELEWLGLDELHAPDAIVLVEWPERGTGALPAADLDMLLQHADPGRTARLEICSRRAAAWLDRAGLAAS